MKRLVFIYYRNYMTRLPQFFVLISIMIFITIMIILANYYNDSFKTSVINDLTNRKLVVTDVDNDGGANASIPELKQITHVEDVYVKYPVVSLLDENNVRLNFAYKSFGEIKFYKGKTLDNLLENEIIVLNEYLKGSSNINKLLNFYSSDEIYSFKIVGTYLDDKNKQYYAYVSEKLMIELLDKEGISIPQKTYYVIANDYRNVPSIIQKLEISGYSVNYDDDSGIAKISSYKVLLSTIKAVVIILIVISFIALYIIINNMIVTENKDISIMKVSGYNKNQILSIISLRIMLLVFVSILSVLILYNILCLIPVVLNFNNSFLIFLKKSYLLNLMSLVALSLVLLFISYISCLINSTSLNKISPILLFKN